MQNYTRNEWVRCKITLETGREDAKLHSKRVKNIERYTLDEYKAILDVILPSGPKPLARDMEAEVVFIGDLETYSRIRLLRSYGNLQSYWTTAKLWKLTVVLDYPEAMETYSRIGLLRSY